MLNAGMAKRKFSPKRRQRPSRDPASPNHDPERYGRLHSGGNYWIYGTHAAFAALANPNRKCRRIIATSGFIESHAEMLNLDGVDTVKRTEIEEMLPSGAVHQGIAVQVAPLTDLTVDEVLADVSSKESACVVVLDQATDPRNIGAILRSAAAFGILCLIVQDRHAPPETGSMAKAASGALENVPVVRVTNLVRTIGELKKLGFWCVGMDGSAETSLAKIRLNGYTTFVFGAEGSGLRRLTRETCDIIAKIPLSGQTKSLNLANAVGISLYEWSR